MCVLVLSAVRAVRALEEEEEEEEEILLILFAVVVWVCASLEGVAPATNEV